MHALPRLRHSSCPLQKELFTPNPKTTVCGWKGVANCARARACAPSNELFAISAACAPADIRSIPRRAAGTDYDVKDPASGEVQKALAWQYNQTKPAASHFQSYIAFYPPVRVQP